MDSVYGGVNSRTLLNDFPVVGFVHYSFEPINQTYLQDAGS